MYLAKNISVDSGGIVIADPKILGGDYSQLKKIGGYATFRIRNGTYRCTWRVLNSVADNPDKATGKGTLKVVSGGIIVVDPSYVEVGDFGRPNIKGVVEVDETGGDGSFNVEFSLKRK